MREAARLHPIRTGFGCTINEVACWVSGEKQRAPPVGLAVAARSCCARWSCSRIGRQRVFRRRPRAAHDEYGRGSRVLRGLAPRHSAKASQGRRGFGNLAPGRTEPKWQIATALSLRQCFFGTSRQTTIVRVWTRGVGGDRNIWRDWPFRRTWVMPSTPSATAAIFLMQFVRRPRPGTSGSSRGRSRSVSVSAVFLSHALSLARSCLPSRFPMRRQKSSAPMRWVTNRRFWHEFDITGSVTCSLESLLSRCKPFAYDCRGYQPDRDRRDLCRRRSDRQTVRRASADQGRQ